MQSSLFWCQEDERDVATESDMRQESEESAAKTTDTPDNRTAEPTEVQSDTAMSAPSSGRETSSIILAVPEEGSEKSTLFLVCLGSVETNPHKNTDEKTRKRQKTRTEVYLKLNTQTQGATKNGDLDGQG